MVRTMISSQWCCASKNALTSGVVIRGARFPYNTERIAEVERRRIESKKSWAAKGGYIGRDGKESRSYFWARQYLVHQLCGLSLLNLQVIPARRLRKKFASTSPEATPLLIWGDIKTYIDCSLRTGETHCNEMHPCGFRQLFPQQSGSLGGR